jgi:hypothetical protein
VYPCCTRRKNVTKEAKAWSASVRQCTIWNKHCAFIESTSSFIYTAPGRKPVPVRDSSKLQNTMANKASDMTVYDWLKHPLRQQFHQTDFFPSLDESMLPGRFLRKEDLNLFQGYAIDRAKAGPGNIQPLLDHIKNIWCNGDTVSYEYTLDWLATVVQRPCERTRIVLVLISKEGVGKGMVLTDIIGEILGEQCFLSESRKDNIFGPFNSGLSCKTLVVLNELLWAGSHEAAGIFKDMITDKRVTINEKHQVQRPETCSQNYCICTQGPWAVPASCESRRFFVLEPSERYCGNQNDESEAYFDRVASVEPKHFADYLYKRDLTGFNPRKVPITTGLTKQKEQSLAPLQSAILECLTRGYVKLESDCKVPFDGSRFDRNTLRSSLTEEFKTLHGFATGPQKFWAALNDACSAKGKSFLEDMGRSREPGGTQKVHLMRFWKLEECRSFWDTHMFRPSNGWPVDSVEQMESD